MNPDYEQKPIIGPFKGIVSSSPKPYIPPNAFDNLINWFIYRGRLLTRNKSVAFTTAPDGANIYNLVPFNDILLNPHNLILTAKNAYALTPGPVWNGPLTYQAYVSGTTYAANDAVTFGGNIYVSRTAGNVGNQPDTHPTQWALINPNTVNNGEPQNFEISEGRVYWSNGSMVGTYWDGETTIKSMLTPGSFFFIGQLANSMIICNTIEPAPGMTGSVAYPNRIRWSDVGNATSWVEGGSSVAGHKDLLNVPDEITGYMTQGRTGFIYRTNGITMMTPTGLGAAPFQFDDVYGAPKGVGNFYPNSLDHWGTTCFFASSDDIYSFDASSFSAIGGDARDLIFADISTAPIDAVIGTIVVRFTAKFLLMSYWLAIPGVVWIYFFDSRAWVRFKSTVGPRVTTVGGLVV